MEWTITKLVKAIEPFVRSWIREMIGEFEVGGANVDKTWIQGTGIPRQDKTGNRGAAAIDLQITNYAAAEIASGDYSAIGGGRGNKADGNYSGALAGWSNYASGVQSVVCGGTDNRVDAAADNGAILGGWSHRITGDESAILNGSDNQVSGDFSVILNGDGSRVSHDHCVAFGYYALSRSPNSFVIGRRESNLGDAQTAVYILREEITLSDTNWHNLYIVSTSSINIPINSCFVFDVLLTGTNSTVTRSFGFKITGVIENDGGTTSILGTPTVTTLYNADDVSIGAQAVADDTNDVLLIQVQDTDGAGGAILWVARVHTAEVQWND